MTEQEAIEIIKHKVGRFQNDLINDALNVAIKALEEVQQYREIGTVEEIKEQLAELERWHTDHVNKNIKNPFAWTSSLVCHNCDHKDDYIEELEAEIEEYQAIGTVEECRAAMEKMKAKKTKTKVNEEDVRIGCVVFAKGTKVHYCPECNRPVTGADVYCRNCGQALIW